MSSSQISRIRRAGLFLLTLVIALGVVGSAEAAKKKKTDEKDKGKNFTVTEQMHKRLISAYEALEANEYQQAAVILKELEARERRLTPYERALVYQMLGQTEAGQERYKEALVYFEKCLEGEALPHGQIMSIRYSIAQLYMATEQFEAAISTLEKWFAEVETPNANAYYLLAAAYYQLDQVDKAIVPAETAIKISTNPKPPWLQLLVGLYYETKQYPKAVKPLEMLIMVDPKKEYWTQLSSLYAHLDQEDKSLAIMQLAYAQDFLTKNSDLRALAQLYLYHSLPHQAGMVLEKGGKDGIVEQDAIYWEMLANSWLLARETERALLPLQTGAEISDKGSLYARLGQLYLEREQWADACSALNKAVARGGLHDEATTHLLLAICHYQQRHYQDAIKHLRVARLSEAETIRNSANQWIMLVERDAQALRDEQDEEAFQAERAAQPEEEPPSEEAPQTDEAPLGEEAPQAERAAQPDEAPAIEQLSQAP